MSRKDACDNYKLLRCRSARRARSLLDVLLVPRQVALHPIALITRSLNAVVLVWIDNQLRVDPETAQRLVHLLTTLDGNVEVAFAAHEQRRRLNAIGVQERVRNLHVRFPRFRIPRRTNLVIVLNDVLIGAVESDSEGRACAAGGCFESIVGRDQVIGQDTAVTPAADTESVGICDAYLDNVIDSG